MLHGIFCVSGSKDTAVLYFHELPKKGIATGHGPRIVALQYLAV